MKPTETIEPTTTQPELDLAYGEPEPLEANPRYQAILNQPKRLRHVNHHDVIHVCDAIERGHTLKTACLFHALPYESILQAAYGQSTGDRTYKPPTRPRWRELFDCARAACLDFWLERLRTADGKGLGVVKAAEFMLSAIDRPRFAPTDDRGGAVNVQVMIGPGAGPTTVKAEVIGSTPDATKLIQDGTHPGPAADAPTPLVVQHLDCGPDVPDA